MNNPNDKARRIRQSIVDKTLPVAPADYDLNALPVSRTFPRPRRAALNRNAGRPRISDNALFRQAVDHLIAVEAQAEHIHEKRQPTAWNAQQKAIVHAWDALFHLVDGLQAVP